MVWRWLHACSVVALCVVGGHDDARARHRHLGAGCVDGDSAESSTRGDASRVRWNWWRLSRGCRAWIGSRISKPSRGRRSSGRGWSCCAVRSGIWSSRSSRCVRFEVDVPQPTRQDAEEAHLVHGLSRPVFGQRHDPRAGARTSGAHDVRCQARDAGRLARSFRSSCWRATIRRSPIRIALFRPPRS